MTKAKALAQVDPDTGEILGEVEPYNPLSELDETNPDVSGRAELLLENSDGALDLNSLDRISMPSGDARQWKIPGLVNDVYASEVEMIVLNAGRARAWWEGELGDGDAFPACSSADGVQGVAATEAGPGLQCAICPKSQWGSSEKAGSERGQACREFRVIAGLVLPSLALTILRVSPTSIRAWDAYAMRLTNNGVSMLDVVTRVSLTPTKNRAGIAYSLAEFHVSAQVDHRQAAAIRDVARMIKTAARVDFTDTTQAEISA